MMSLVRHACSAILMLLPFTSALASDSVASAICQQRQDNSQLSLMQVQAAARKLMKAKSHFPTVEQFSSIESMGLAGQESHQETEIPTLDQVKDAFETFMQTLKDIGQNANSTLTSALTTGEKSINEVSRLMEVAETTLNTAAGMLGAKAEHVAEVVKDLSDRLQAEIQNLAGQSESFRQQLTESLQGIYDSITGQEEEAVTKMETASDEVEAAVNASNANNASLMQLQATLAQVQNSVEAGCLSKADTAALLQKHGRGSWAAHLQEMDSNGDGCLQAEELDRSNQQPEAPFRRDGEVAMLMFRAAAGASSSSSALEAAVARKGTPQDPCSVATSALSAANSSILSLEDKLAGVNVSIVSLMEQGLYLVEASFQVVNSTVSTGLQAALGAGLPSRMAEPVENELGTMMGGFDSAATTMRDAEASASEAILSAINSFTPTIIAYIDAVASKLALVCS